MSLSRNVLAAVLACPTLVACGMNPDDYGTQFDSMSAVGPPPITAACTADVTTLAAIPGMRGDLLLEDDAALYVVAGDASVGGTTGDSIYRVPKSGAAPELLAANQRPVVAFAFGLASVDAGRGAIYWTTRGRGQEARGEIWKVNAIGAAPVVVASNRASPGPLVVSSTHVYWGESRPDGAAIAWAPLAGGPVTTWQLLPGRQVPAGLVYLAGRLVWSAAEAAGATSEISSATLPLSFGAVTSIDARKGEPALIVASLRTLFIGDADGVTVVTGPLDPRLTIAATAPVRHLDANDDVVYFVDPGLHALIAASPGPLAGPPRRLASDVADGSVRFDAGCVYFVDQASGALRMVHR